MFVPVAWMWPANPVSASVVGDNDWLGTVNAYRSMSGLAPIGVNPTWSAQAREHSCYMLVNGITHYQEAGKPLYSEGGRLAGANGNVAVSSNINATARSHVELWMTGPFHAIGLLRHNLATTGFGLCTNPDAPRWKSGATIDVLRGLNWSIPRPSSPTVFPGRDATVPLYRFIAESPNPVTLCGWSGDAGLPLIAMMPAKVTSASSTLTGPNGPVQTCTLHPQNTNDSVARAVLDADNAITVVPRTHLTPGRYTATVTSNGGSVTWSFTVDPNAPLQAAAPPSSPSPQPTQAMPAPRTSTIGEPRGFVPTTPYRLADSRQGLLVSRLSAGQVRRIPVASADVAAISANFTVTESIGDGYLTIYNCSSRRPEVSTLNFRSGSIANQAIVPLSGGTLCVYSMRDTHLIIDVNGTFEAGANAARFTPSTPSRRLDSRSRGGVLAPGEVRSLRVAGVSGGAPGDATAVAVNLTAVDPRAEGYLRAFPCNSGGRSDVSNVNFRAGVTRPNSAIVPVGADGTICLQSNVSTHVIVDLNGWFRADSGLRFTPLELMRVIDTRRFESWANPITGTAHLTPGRVERIQISGLRGIPTDAKAVTINVTGVDAQWDGFVTVYPCGNRPNVSTLNVSPADPAVANGSLVGLSGSGQLCLYSSTPVHLVIDISGVWR